MQSILAIAGTNTRPLTRTVGAALERPASPAAHTIGDRVRAAAHRHAAILTGFTDDVCPDERGGVRVRQGRAWTLPEARKRPLIWDCAAMARYRGAAPRWASLSTYCAGIELVQPDMYFTYDTIGDLAATKRAYADLCTSFPDDAQPGGRLWPVWPVTATWDGHARVRDDQLPARLRGLRSLSDAIPLNSTQRHYRPERLAEQARLTLANAQRLIDDPAVRAMIERHGQIALGGMAIAGNPAPRLARHLLALALVEAFPGARIWLLGQASFAVVNGLGQWGLLDKVSVDGTWYLHDARCGRLAYLNDGLITMWRAGTGRGSDGGLRTDLFLPRDWLIAGNLYALLGAYAGAWQWPSVPLPPPAGDRAAIRGLQGDLWQALATIDDLRQAA